MAEINDGGPAFPDPDGQANYTGGMTLRDYFAAHAPPMPEQWWKDSKGDGHHWADASAAWAYFYADAMIAQRSKT